MHVDNRFLGDQITLTTKNFITTISRIADNKVDVVVRDRRKGSAKYMTLGDEKIKSTESESNDD